MIRRAVATRVSQLSSAFRRLLCADAGVAKPQQSANTVTAPHAGAPKPSNSITEVLVPDLSDLQPIAESKLFTAEAATAAFSSKADDAPPNEAPGAGAPDGTAGMASAVGGDSADAAQEGNEAPVEQRRQGGGDGEGLRSQHDHRIKATMMEFETDQDFIEFFINAQRFSRPVRAVYLFKALLESPNSDIITTNVLRVVMPAMSRLGWNVTIFHALDFAHEKGMDLITPIVNMGLKGLMRSGDTDEMRVIIERMWKGPKRNQPDAATYNCLIGAYFFKGQVDDAYDVLKEMKNHMIFPVWNTYQLLISGCLRSGEPRRAMETLLAVERDASFTMNAPLLAQVITMAAEDDDMSAVSQLVPRFEASLIPYEGDVLDLAERRPAYRLKGSDGMMGENQETQTAQTRGTPGLEISAIMACLRAGYRGSRPDICEKSMQWFAEMYPEMEVPVSAWYCLVGSYATSGNFTAAFDVLSRMRRSGVQPALQDLNEALIKPLAVDLNVVDEQYYRLADILRPEEAAARIAGQKGDGDASAKESSSKDSVSADVADGPSEDGGAEKSADATPAAKLSFTQELLGLRDANGDEVSRRELSADPVFEKDEERTIGVEEFNCIIAACSMVGDLHRAFHTFDEAQRLGFVGNVDTYNALLNGCLSDKHYAGGIRVAEEMRESGVTWNGETVLLLVRLCIRCGRFDDARAWLVKAVDEGVPVGSVAFQTMAKKLMRLGRLDDLREIVSLGERIGLSSTAVLARIENSFLKDLPLLATDQSSIHRTIEPNARRNDGYAKSEQSDEHEPTDSSRNY